VEPASAFSATINWGDGTTSPGAITESGTTYSVTGSHTYSGGGRHTISTTVTETGQAVQKIDTDPGTLPLDERDVVQLPPARKHDLGGDSVVKGTAASEGGALVVSATPAGQQHAASGGAAPAAYPADTGTRVTDQFFTDLVLALLSAKRPQTVTEAIADAGA
jgi:hypothetical protein